MKRLFLIVGVLLVSLTMNAQTLQSVTDNGASTTNNIGIGTSSISARLHVASGPGYTLLLEKTSNNVPALAFKGLTEYSMIEAGDDYMTMYTGGVRHFTLLANGYVGIGTITPSEKLAVNGKIRAHEVKVETTNWPDYVFHENYSLRPLDEVRRFIKLNGHLPEIPSAAEVQKEGVNLGEMNARLLNKIEELTLYLLEKDRQVADLQEKTRSLERRLEKFETK